MSPFKPSFRRALAGGLLLLGLGLGCGSSEAPKDALQKYANYHPAKWVDDGTSGHANDHQGQAVRHLADCKTCHSMTKLQVGPAPSCMTSACHHGTKPDWRLTSHAQVDPTRADACALCHFPNSPQNPSNIPNVTPPAPGAMPDCFNGTLCHGDVAAPHPTRATTGGLDYWRDPKVAGGPFHGDQAKQNLRYCQSCHGTPGTPLFDRGSQKCSDCHTPSTGAGAHPSLLDTYTGLSAGVTPSVWNAAPSTTPYVPSHRDMGNAATLDWQTRANDAGCNLCHNTASTTTGPLPSAPSCFSGQFTPAGATATAGCHAAGPGSAPHPLGAPWKNPLATGSSPTDPAVFHGAQAKQDLAYCQTCHGTPGTPKFDGGSASTACSSCHRSTGAGAHPSLLDDYSSLGAGAPAPAAWNPVASGTPYIPSHRIAGNLSTACAICHLTTQPPTVPSSGFNGPVITAPNCWSVTVTPAGGTATSCHANGPSAAPTHPVPFLAGQVTTPLGNGHMSATAATFTAECATCHIVTGTPTNSAPACATCHTAAATNSPVSADGANGQGKCLSCHKSGPAGLQAGPTGTAYPDIAGAHAKHMTLAGVTCETCHSGLGSGTRAHYDAANARVSTPTAPAATAFLAAYNAKSGTISASATVAPTCSNVACHGGVATPTWTGSLPAASTATTSNNYCRACHVSGTTQYNGYWSGEHSRHIAAGALCTDCHNVTTGATGTAHWAHLETSALEGTPSATIQFSSRANFGPTPTYANGSCTLTCHTINGNNQTHNPERW